MAFFYSFNSITPSHQVIRSTADATWSCFRAIYCPAAVTSDTSLLYPKYSSPFHIIYLTMLWTISGNTIAEFFCCCCFNSTYNMAAPFATSCFQLIIYKYHSASFHIIIKFLPIILLCQAPYKIKESQSVCAYTHMPLNMHLCMYDTQKQSASIIRILILVPYTNILKLKHIIC